MKLFFLSLILLISFPSVSYAKGCLGLAQCIEFASNGDAESQFQLGLHYNKIYRKDELPKELTQHIPAHQLNIPKQGAQNMSVHYLKWAAKQGHTDAQILLATHYFEGIKGKIHYQEAEKWFKKAAESGHDEAQVSLATLYYYDHIKGRGFDDAFKWYLKSSKQGNADAQNFLGAMYMAGQSVDKDIVIAYAWTKLSAEKGSDSAIKLKSHLEGKLSSEQKNEAEDLAKEFQKMYKE